MILGEPIILGGGGGIPVVIIVETEPGANVLCINGATVLSKTANADGKAVFEVKKEGLWTIQASLDGEIVETEVFVEHKIEEELAFITADPVLANNSWEKISEIARAGKASDFWNIGDEKPVTIGSYSYTAQIMGFDHYEVADPETYGRTMAGILFQTKETNTGSEYGPDSASRAVSMVTGSPDIGNLAVEFKYPKREQKSDTSPKTYTAKAVVPTEFEYAGTKTKETVQVGTQYPFYAAGNSRIKNKVGKTTKADHWTRSLVTNGSSPYLYCNTSGSFTATTYDGDTAAVAPVFCL